MTSKSLERTLSLRCLCFAFLYFVCVRPSFYLFVHSVRKAVCFFLSLTSLAGNVDWTGLSEFARAACVAGRFMVSL